MCQTREQKRATRRYTNIENRIDLSPREQYKLKQAATLADNLEQGFDTTRFPYSREKKRTNGNPKKQQQPVRRTPYRPSGSQIFSYEPSGSKPCLLLYMGSSFRSLSLSSPPEPSFGVEGTRYKRKRNLNARQLGEQDV
jgi:hypothetical protein